MMTPLDALKAISALRPIGDGKTRILSDSAPSSIIAERNSVIARMCDIADSALLLARPQGTPTVTDEMKKVIGLIVRSVCELPGDDGAPDGIPDDQKLILSISDLEGILENHLEGYALSRPLSDVRDGWVLVPIEPTAAMIEAAYRGQWIYPRDIANHYRAMLAASPSPVASSEEK